MNNKNIKRDFIRPALMDEIAGGTVILNLVMDVWLILVSSYKFDSGSLKVLLDE